MKQYTLETRMKDQDVMNFNINHKTDAEASKHLNNILTVLLENDALSNTIEYYELYRIDDDKRVMIDENYFV